MKVPLPPPSRFARARALSLAVLLVWVAGGCTANLRHVSTPPASIAIPTAYPVNSMIFAARTDDGVVLVDLGWYRSGRALERGLARIGATPEDVTDVFVTHSHRDHIGAWRTVRHARFHMGADEVPVFEGVHDHADVPSRAGRLVTGNPAPWPGEVAVRPFSRDTAFVFGTDTLRAFVIPGHTPGSAAYLLRGVLFTGDAVVRSYWDGIGPGFRIFSRDMDGNRESLRALFARVERYDVEWVCTAHAKCARPDERFMKKVLR